MKYKKWFLTMTRRPVFIIRGNQNKDERLIYSSKPQPSGAEYKVFLCWGKVSSSADVVMKEIRVLWIVVAHSVCNDIRFGINWNSRMWLILCKWQICTRRRSHSVLLLQWLPPIEYNARGGCWREEEGAALRWWSWFSGRCGRTGLVKVAKRKH